MIRRLAAVTLLGLSLAACSTDHALPTALPDAPALARGGEDGGSVRVNGRYEVAMLDNCDPSSPWPGGCTIAGTVTLQAFSAAVAALGLHPDWRFDPANIVVKPNAKLRVPNLGGREHTFTRVAQFGGGFVPQLNNPARIPDTGRVAPECNPALVDFIEPGEATEVRTDHGGGKARDHDERYQCCIHPWMRATVHVRHAAPR
jgi:hypothetical protein